MKTIITIIASMFVLNTMAQEIEIDKKRMPEGLYFGMTPIHGFTFEKGTYIETTLNPDGTSSEREINRAGYSAMQFGFEAKLAYQINPHFNTALFSKISASTSALVDVGIQVEYNPIRVIGIYARAGQSFDLDDPEGDAVVMGGGLNLNFPFLSNRFFMGIHLGVNYKEIILQREDNNYTYPYTGGYSYTILSDAFESEQFIIDTGISFKWKLGK